MEHCDLENIDEKLFITKLIYHENQKELLKETVEPRKAPEVAINMKIGMQNQKQIQTHNKTLLLASVNAKQYPPSTRSSNCSLTNNFHRQDI